MIKGLSINFNVGSLKLTIHLSILVFLAAALITKTLTVYLLTILFIFIHELGHTAAAIISGGRVHGIRLLPVGFTAEIDQAACSKRQRVFIYSAGPCVSFLFAIIFSILIFLLPDSSTVRMGTYINLYLGSFNLLPVLPLDGGKLTMELLSTRYGTRQTGKKLQLVSVILSILIMLEGIISLINGRNNASLIIIGIYILMCIRGNREEAAFMNIKNFLFRRSRIMKKGVYPVRQIVVLKHVKLSEVIKAMDYIDRFHIINVLDENFRVIKVMTEQEILDAIIGNTPDTTFDKLVQIEYNDHNNVVN
ncbi:MAG: peptidase [Eubacterium sp.]|jgi:stage IV sporulation protein FB|nr:peptidase [Eubacterium sp.]